MNKEIKNQNYGKSKGTTGKNVGYSSRSESQNDILSRVENEYYFNSNIYCDDYIDYEEK